MLTLSVKKGSPFLKAGLTPFAGSNLYIDFVDGMAKLDNGILMLALNVTALTGDNVKAWDEAQEKLKSMSADNPIPILFEIHSKDWVKEKWGNVEGKLQRQPEKDEPQVVGLYEKYLFDNLSKLIDQKFAGTISINSEGERWVANLIDEICSPDKAHEKLSELNPIQVLPAPNNVDFYALTIPSNGGGNRGNNYQRKSQGEIISESLDWLETALTPDSTTYNKLLNIGMLAPMKSWKEAQEPLAYVLRGLELLGMMK